MEEKKPKVSVLIPAYNAEKFIQRTIDSVLVQTFDDFEIVVLDDGSNDRTGDIVKSMRSRDKRVVYYYQDNQGLVNSRNRLVELSRGKFIAFLDHDDEWLPDKLKKQLPLFDKIPQPGLVFSDTYIKNNVRVIGRSFRERRPFRGDVFYQYLLSDNFAPLLTVILPREVLLKFMPFNPDYQVNEEFEMFLRIARDHKFDYIDEPLAVYHVHGRNTIISKHKRLIVESFAILDHWIKEDSHINTHYKKSLKQRFAQLYCKKGIYYLSVHDYPQVLGAIVKSF
ncbi:MAG: glycosyltransferase, partial [Candidatus Omnitrophica bacterium]|nr:glycosyltransferase [Candidatus Omnitrophota bacterium]